MLVWPFPGTYWRRRACGYGDAPGDFSRWKNIHDLRIKRDCKRGLQKGANLISSDVRPMLDSGRADLTPWMTNAPVGDIYLSAGSPSRDLNILLAFP